MPNIKCITPDCPMWISDPCVKTNALFQIRTDLLDRLAEAPDDKQIPANINQVDSIIESELGFQDVRAQHKLFKNSGAAMGVSHLFTLVCVLGHKINMILNIKAVAINDTNVVSASFWLNVGAEEVYNSTQDRKDAVQKLQADIAWNEEHNTLIKIYEVLNC